MVANRNYLTLDIVNSNYSHRSFHSFDDVLIVSGIFLFLGAIPAGMVRAMSYAITYGASLHYLRTRKRKNETN